MDKRIPPLQYPFLANAFYEFAAAARQYHFYDEEINRMEKSIMEMNPYPQKKKGDRV
jgi:hypothetical protein